MRYRTIALALLAACAFATPAFARQEQLSSSASVSAEEIEAARDFYRAVLFDSGAMDTIYQAVSGSLIPELQREIRDTPLYGDASPAHRDALIAYLGTLPALIQRETTTELNAILESASPRLAARMTREEFTQTAAFMRSDAMRPLWRDLAQAAVDTEGQSNLGTFPDWRSVGSFAGTPAGQAFAREEAAIAAILEEEFDIGMQRMTPRLSLLIAAGICEVLEEECPASVRNALGNI